MIKGTNATESDNLEGCALNSDKASTRDICSLFGPLQNFSHFFDGT